MIRVFIVDDHAVVRQGTRSILETSERIEVVGEAASGEELAGLLRLRQPDVLLLDINLPGKNGFELLAELKSQFPDLRIILFSAYNETPYIRRARILKADGFISKTSENACLQQAIMQVHEGAPEMVLSPDLAQKLGEADEESPDNRLTPREIEILPYVARGMTNREIAKELMVSVKTVDSHVANLLKKTGASSRGQLISLAYEQGWI